MFHKANFKVPGKERVSIGGVEFACCVFEEGEGFRGEVIHENGNVIVSSEHCEHCEDCWALILGALHVWATTGRRFT